MFELGPRAAEYHVRVFDHAAALGLGRVIAVGALASACRCDASYPSVDALRADLGRLLAPGDLVLLKASHGLQLGSILS
jgi:UDP-N-acetylmuramyl pentapeptide synthase